MTTLLVYGGVVYTPFRVIEGGAVLARDGVIERVGTLIEVGGGADVQVDADGRMICPGFVDLQVNGGGGALLTERPDVEAVARMTAAHARFGTTSMLPTIVTSPEERLARGLAAVADAMAQPTAGARILGAHMEGPFLNPKRKGAHDERYLRAPDIALLERLVAASGGTLRLVTLAPELPGALELIAAARRAGVAVAIGHTDASYEEALAGIDAGAGLATHLFNAMHPLAQREPGVIGALLERDDVITGIIADAVHVHPSLLSLAARAKGPDGLALVTDAMSPVGADGETFELYGDAIEVRDGACYTKDGVLAGSALSMNRAVRLMHMQAHVPLPDCVRMAAATPARAIGLEGEVGSLREGARADIVICDEQIEVWKVFVGGELVYDAAT